MGWPGVTVGRTVAMFGPAMSTVVEVIADIGSLRNVLSTASTTTSVVVLPLIVGPPAPGSGTAAGIPVAAAASA